MQNTITSYSFFKLSLHGVFFLVALCTTIDVLAQKKKPIPKVVQAQVQISKPKIVSYEVLENGDTINKLDDQKARWGNWLIHQESRYNEPSFYEYGPFENNIKIGKWVTYDNDGRVSSEENYKQGLKDGEARYFDHGKLYCVGNYLALRSKFDYDTIYVEDPVTNIDKPVRIKSETGYVKHGFWTYYDPLTSKVDRVVEYQVDEVIYEKDYTLAAGNDSTAASLKLKTLPHVNKQQPNNVWILDKNKRPAKYTDIPDNTQYVKPNVRRNK